MDKYLDAIVTTVIAHRQANTDRTYYGGAKARIIAQIPKGITDPEELIDHLEVAFEREENCYW